jgi:hypothetical protein
MEDNKILNLTDFVPEDVELIKEVIEDWKTSGFSGTVVHISDEDVQESLTALKDLIQKTYNKGVWRGGLALAGGFLLGDLICKVVAHLTTKDNKSDRSE